MRHHFRHPQAMFNKGSLFYSHCGKNRPSAKDSSVNNRQVALTIIIKQLNVLMWPISLIKKSKFSHNLLLNKLSEIN
jgi:hypothetical protein